MERQRKKGKEEGGGLFVGGKLLSANDHVLRWHLNSKKAKERQEKEKKDGDGTNKKKGGKSAMSDPHKRRKDGERGKHPKSPRKGFWLDLKSLTKAKTAREPHETHPEMKRFRKPSDKVVVRKEENANGKNLSFYNPWEDITIAKSMEKKDKGRKRQPGGKAVVIYHREKRRDYLHPQTGDGYRFEQIAFAGSCEAAVDTMPSKRSVSDPGKSLKEYYVARRRTRFHLEPQKMSSTPSEFHSAVDIVQETQGLKGDVYGNECGERDLKMKEVVWKSKSTSDSRAEVIRRLKEAADKKLDLHREMIRAERVHKKKFWESIERSLNYRCALADMFSSQSFLSQNNRGGGIYVQESVIEKISSYQGFHRFMTPNGPTSRKRALKSQNLPSATYHKMLVGSIMIKEDEEDQEILGKEANLAERGSSGSSTSSEISVPFETNSSWLPRTVSEKLTLMESSLATNPKTTTELELLMMKLSGEIRNCSNFIKKLSKSVGEEEKRPVTAQRSASDSKVGKEFAAFPVIFPTHVTRKKSSFSEDGESRRQNSVASDVSVYSPSRVSLMTRAPTSVRRNRRRTEFPCCDDCKHLKQRIVKLEQELEKIEKKLPLYPTEYRDSIKTCLERLKATSETVLRRLKNYMQGACSDSEAKRAKQRGKRPVSAPEHPMHESNLNDTTSRRLSLRSSNSDYQLNVGMEITMENVDPITGEKLYPTADNTFQQEGNIRCKLYEDGEDPLMVLDTDFQYNPKTGMLFKNKEATTQDLIIPLRGTIKRTSSKMNVGRAESTERERLSPERVRSDTSPVEVECVVVQPDDKVRTHRVDEMQHIHIPDDIQCIHRPNEMQCIHRLDEMQHVHRPDDMHCIHRLDDMQCIHQPDEMQCVHRPNEMQHVHRPHDMQHIHRPDEMQHIHRSDEMQHIHRSDDMQHIHRSDEAQHVHRPNDMQHIHRPDEVQHVHRLDEQQRVHRPNDMQRLHRPDDKQRVHRPEEMQCMHRMDDMQRLHRLDERQATNQINTELPPKEARCRSKSKERRREPDPGVTKRRVKTPSSVTSRIPTRRKATPSPADFQSGSLSRNSSVSGCSYWEGTEQPIGSSSKQSIKTKGSKSNQRIHRTLFRKKASSKMEKSTQTFAKSRAEEEQQQKPKMKTVAVGVQAAFPVEDRYAQAVVGSYTRSSQVNASATSSSNTANVAIQAEPHIPKNTPMINKELQTNLPTEENLKYLNDLQIQKKVNMAIAELCFHLTKKKDQKKV